MSDSEVAVSKRPRAGRPSQQPRPAGKAEAAVTGSATASPEGIYLRNNLASDGSTPFSPPLDLCPDIIQSDAVVPDPQGTFGSERSWQQAYDTEPTVAQQNYYYLRGMNGTPGDAAADFSLYYAPAQVFMFPSAWKNNVLLTESGAERVRVSAGANAVAVGGDAFVWRPLHPPSPSTYFNLVGRVSKEEDSQDIPEVNGWLDLAALLNGSPSFAFRNQAMVDGAAEGWVHRQQLSVPASFAAPQELSLVISASGMDGAVAGVLCDTFTADRKAIILQPTTLHGGGAITGQRFVLPPGYEAMMAVQLWKPEGVELQPGASLQVTLSYPVPTDAELATAMEQRLVDPRWSQTVSRVLGIQPQPMAIVSSMTFTVG